MLYITKNENLRVDKLVSFIQHDLPGLRSGSYRLKISQTLQNKEKQVFDVPLSAEYTLAVTGDRFSFSNPATAVYSVFPAVNASGRYDTVLPSVVFPKTSFPWTRSPLNDKGTDQLAMAATGTDIDIPTWLTILLLDEEDLSTYAGRYPDFTLVPQIGTIADLFPASMQPGSSLRDHYSYFHRIAVSGSHEADLLLDPSQQFTDSVQTLDIPIPLFRHIAPTIDDLKYMAHIRKVSLVNKATMPGISDVGDPEGSFSIVFGNRLPGNGRKTWAYLVSLENMEDFLPSSAFAPDPEKMVRLAVLKSWTFYSTGDNAAFVDKLKHLNGAETTSGVVNDTFSQFTTLRLPVPEKSIPEVNNALIMGYVPLNHHLRSGKEKEGVWEGEKTVSWYRSPLCPYAVTAARIHPPLVSADQATLYDPTTGLFDVSYASAWTLGRQMALQDKTFSIQLYNWKKQLEHNVQNDTEREHVVDLFANVLAPAFKMSASLRSEKRSSFIERTLTSLIDKK